jgi:hypothetical protein
MQVRGPPAKAAFDGEGKPTKALEGFCRKAGVPLDAVTREADAKGVEYCWVEVKDAGKPAAEVRGQAFACGLRCCVPVPLQGCCRPSCGSGRPHAQSISMSLARSCGPVAMACKPTTGARV